MKSELTQDELTERAKVFFHANIDPADMFLVMADFAAQETASLTKQLAAAEKRVEDAEKVIDRLRHISHPTAKRYAIEYRTQYPKDAALTAPSGGEENE